MLAVTTTFKTSESRRTIDQCTRTLARKKKKKNATTTDENFLFRAYIHAHRCVCSPRSVPARCKRCGRSRLHSRASVLLLVSLAHSIRTTRSNACRCCQGDDQCVRCGVPGREHALQRHNDVQHNISCHVDLLSRMGRSPCAPLSGVRVGILHTACALCARRYVGDAEQRFARCRSSSELGLRGLGSPRLAAVGRPPVAA